MNKTLGLVAAVASLTSLMVAAPAEARHRTHHARQYTRANYACEHDRRSSTNKGTVVGALAGGLLGHAVGGHGAGGTIVGAGVGAVAGHQIASDRAKRRC